MKVQCFSCGEWLEDEDYQNTTCLKCGGEIK